MDQAEKTDREVLEEWLQDPATFTGGQITGAQLRAARQYLGLTRADMAAQLTMSGEDNVRTLRRLESGGRDPVKGMIVSAVYQLVRAALDKEEQLARAATARRVREDVR